MIPAREVYIGAKVLFRGEERVVDEINGNSVILQGHDRVFFENLEGIVITEKWILKRSEHLEEHLIYWKFRTFARGIQVYMNGRPEVCTTFVFVHEFEQWFYLTTGAELRTNG